MDGPRFRDMRRLAGLTQAQAAKRLGCSERNVRDMELGRKPVKRAYAVTLVVDHYHACRVALDEARDAAAHAAELLRRVAEEDE